MADRAGSETSPSERLLRDSEHRDSARGDDELHLDRSDEGTFLERGNQWCSRYSDHAHNDVDDRQSEGDRDARPATTSKSNRMDCDHSNVDGGGGYGRNLEKLASAVAWHPILLEL